jgi:type IV secretion system protein VirB4
VLNVRRLVRDYTTGARAFSELVPWLGLVDERTILNKDGSLLSCFQIEGVEIEGMEQVEADRYALLVEQALRNFDERTMVWTTVERSRTRRYPSAAFDNPVSALVDAEWKKSFDASRQYLNRHYLSILTLPPAGPDSFFEHVAQQIRQAGISVPAALAAATRRSLTWRDAYVYHREALLDSLLAHRARIGAFAETMNAIGLVPLTSSALVGFLHDRCSPANAGCDVKVPAVPFYLDAMLVDNTLTRSPDRLSFRGDKERHCMCVSVKDWPEMLQPGLLDALLSVQGEISISGAFRFMPQEKARQLIQKMEKHHLNLSKTLLAYIKEGFTHQESAQIDAGRLALADDASDALAEMSGGGRMFGHYNLTIAAYGDTREECEATLMEVTKRLRNLGYLLVRETMHLLCVDNAGTTSCDRAMVPGPYRQPGRHDADPHGQRGRPREPASDRAGVASNARADGPAYRTVDAVLFQFSSRRPGAHPGRRPIARGEIDVRQLPDLAVQEVSRQPGVHFRQGLLLPHPDDAAGRAAYQSPRPAGTGRTESDAAAGQQRGLALAGEMDRNPAHVPRLRIAGGR